MNLTLRASVYVLYMSAGQCPTVTNEVILDTVRIIVLQDLLIGRNLIIEIGVRELFHEI